MSIVLHVSILSGQTAAIAVDPDCEIEELRQRAQEALNIGLCKIIHSSGAVLQGTVRTAGLCDGEAISALARPAELFASCRAFALLQGDGSVLTWGAPEFGGDSSAVRSQLKTVEQIASSLGAFCAVRGDGSVDEDEDEDEDEVTWGHTACGGDSSGVAASLRDVRQVKGSLGALAALRTDGSVVSWGNKVLERVGYMLTSQCICM
ncbi:hypothetical protein AK812_SmicGene11280 [Symbiodinium microadriaticum]|uniref:Ubiquitin-like domain-containing protein n=1 Tax=Symbiodinium microadriaticum TaxID=2951 RepID=A0A1Q9EDS0_SYMMI|nr:hypothetical protein AK812_SmicGene11280 [Symbiodinium microadriaticum]